MNHQKTYDYIIQKAKSENRIKLRKNQEGYVYYENHHILPKCLGGNNNEENLVLLTAKEHFVCHKVLTYIYKENRKIACAFHKMSFGIHNIAYKISSRDYAYARELISITPISNETREKLSKATKGKPSKKRGTHLSDETKRKLSEKGKGRKVSLQTRQNISNGQKGKKLSQEHKEKLRKTKLSKPGHKHTEKFKNKISENNKKYKTGIKVSTQTRIKMSITRKGVKKTEEHKRKILEGRKKYFEKRRQEKLLHD